MTCTHAAIQRAQLLELGFQYDTLVMEEAAQVLDVETFIPMVVQARGAADSASGRLSRVILLGDHHQLPPIIQNMALQRYSRLDQSMFTRLVRLGLPVVQLHMQGRARPTLAAMYAWRYKALGNLPNTTSDDAYLRANAGLAYVAQFIDVPDFKGRGESCPAPYFYQVRTHLCLRAGIACKRARARARALVYACLPPPPRVLQNLGEAEYLVAFYQYLRLVGYPASRISILTTYKGQQQLLTNIVAKRCTPFAMFGAPAAVETVDRFQGQQNDIILLSLVRTGAVGHIRDLRRAVVALSRAKYGLYVFGRASVFKACADLTPALAPLWAVPNRLHLLVGEMYPATRAADAPLEAVVSASGGTLSRVVVDDVLSMGAIVSSMMQTKQLMAAMASLDASTIATVAAAAGASAVAATTTAAAAASAASVSAQPLVVDSETLRAEDVREGVQVFDKDDTLPEGDSDTE